MRNVLITGFERFDGALSNPTEDMLIGLEHEQFNLMTLVLPVEFERSFEVLKQVIISFKPDDIILCGLAGNRTEITVEKVAINYINARISDNSGIQPLDVKVSETGDDGYFSTFAITELISYMQQRDIVLNMSFHAGSYVCNYLLYKCLQLLKGSNTTATFLHFPPIGAGKSVASYQCFLMHLLDFIHMKPDMTRQDIGLIARQFAAED
jgi:pyroglutamyl-peptidase